MTIQKALVYGIVLSALGLAWRPTYAQEDTGDAPPPGLTESDSTADLPTQVAGDGNHALDMVRVDDSGRRRIEYRSSGGSTLATFLDDAAIYPLAAAGAYSPGQAETLVCAEVSTQFPSIDAGLGVACAVKQDGAAGFEPTYTQMGPGGSQPNAFAAAICPGAQGADFVVLYKPGQNPIADVLDPTAAQDSMMSMPACRELMYTKPAGAASGGWSQGSVATRCSCDELPGAPCTDPCFAGTGTIDASGKCDLSGHPSACDDGDPNTADSCTGDPTNLCEHDPVQ